MQVSLKLLALKKLPVRLKCHDFTIATFPVAVNQTHACTADPFKEMCSDFILLEGNRLPQPL